jgi:hypothetical protein
MQAFFVGTSGTAPASYSTFGTVSFEDYRLSNKRCPVCDRTKCSDPNHRKEISRAMGKTAKNGRMLLPYYDVRLDPGQKSERFLRHVMVVFDRCVVCGKTPHYRNSPFCSPACQTEQWRIEAEVARTDPRFPCRGPRCKGNYKSESERNDHEAHCSDYRREFVM